VSVAVTEAVRNTHNLTIEQDAYSIQRMCRVAQTLLQN